jgi:hypothetical protein
MNSYVYYISNCLLEKVKKFQQLFYWYKHHLKSESRYFRENNDSVGKIIHQLEGW